MDIKTTRNPGDKVYIIDPKDGTVKEAEILGVMVIVTKTATVENFSFVGVQGARSAKTTFSSKKELIASL